MTSPHPATEAWAEWWRRLDALRISVTRVKGAIISSVAVRTEAKEAVQHYFRQVRTLLIALRFDGEQIDALDQISQHILELAANPNRKSTYRICVRELNRLRGAFEAAIEIRAGGGVPQPATRLTTATEAAIIETLDGIVPTIALSYRQVLQDLSDQTRVSYRGTASELREVLRELLDHLAPDADVLKSGVVLEKGHTTPTMKQKTVFILKARGVGETARKPATDAVTAIEGAVGSLARSVYNRGSLSTHIATTRTEVLTFKGYTDAVLADLLQIHK
jgi:hypothetical protein